MRERVFIGMGGNVGDVASAMQSAMLAIGDLPETQLIACSSLYSSPAHGGIVQADYLNAVLEIQTAASPQALLEALLAIERDHGRDRATEQRWGPRRLDLDILLFGHRIIDESELQIPHPRLAERVFVLAPLAELDKDLTIPGLGALMPLLDDIIHQPIRRDAKGRLNV
jgi:2-amino-4-hydroxy-6-hydroxymethyldihydropteridine diphosphokinase